MGRGAYDTTGIRRPIRHSLASPSESLTYRAHDGPVDSRPSPAAPQPSSLLPGPMDVESSGPDPVDHRNEASRDQPLATSSMSSQVEQREVPGLSMPPVSGTVDDASRGTRPLRFTEEQKLPFEQWMANNQSSPYPTAVDKEQLAKVTGLSKEQVEEYCRNYRRRKLKKSFAGPAASVTSAQNAPGSTSLLDNDGNDNNDDDDDVEMELSIGVSKSKADSPTSTEEDVLGASIEARPPSHRFERSSQSPDLGHRNSPAARVEEDDDGNVVMPSLSASNETHLDWWLRWHCQVTGGTQQLEDVPNILPSHPGVAAGPMSLISVEPGPSIVTRYSADDVQSTVGSMHSTRGSRRGRRAYGDFPNQQTPTLNVNAAHRCERCGNTFKTAFTLKRHIQSLHETNKRWVCAPVVRADGSLLCPTCLQDPIVCSHGMLSCWEKRELDRTFYRKDLLKQHLKLVHDFDSGPTTPGNGNVLDLLGAHTPCEAGVDSILRQMAPQVVGEKLACYDWSSREHEMSREMFDACWADALGRAFGLRQVSAAQSTEPGNQEVADGLLVRLQELIEMHEADGKDAQGLAGPS